MRDDGEIGVIGFGEFSLRNVLRGVGVEISAIWSKEEFELFEVGYA